MITAAALAFLLIGGYFGKKDDSDKASADGGYTEKRDYSGFALGTPLLSASDISVSARSAVLCTDGGLMLYEKNADIPLPMASITKVMTAVVALEALAKDGTDVTEALKREIQVDKRAVGAEGSSVYLKAGETVTLEMLLYSLMLESANDAALAIAYALFGSEETFVSAMNEKAAELSMSSTAFKNPHGLSEDGHYTTARDYSRLMAYALEDPVFTEMIGTKKKIFSSENGEKTRVLTNHNRLLNTYKNMIGGKTGFTKLSGRTLVTAAEKDGTRLICVTINAPDDWNDHTSLYEKGFSLLRTEILTPEKCSTEIPVAGGAEMLVKCAPRADLKVTVGIDAEVTVKYFCPQILFAPITAERAVGRIEVYADGEKVAEAELYTLSAVDGAEKVENGGALNKLIGFFRKRSAKTV